MCQQKQRNVMFNLQVPDNLMMMMMDDDDDKKKQATQE